MPITVVTVIVIVMNVVTGRSVMVVVIRGPRNWWLGRLGSAPG